MPANVYLDGDATGNNDGTSEADAYTDPTNAGVLGITAGETLHISKTTSAYTPSTDMVFTGTGTAASPVTIIGYDNGFVLNGVRPVFDGASTRSMGFNLGATQDFFNINNIELKNNTAHGITGSSSTDGCVLINVWTHDNGANGINGFRYFRFIRCMSSANAVGVKNGASAGVILYCTVFDNSSNGIEVSTNISCFISDSLVYDNGGIGVRGNHLCVVKNTVLHGNTGDNIDVFSNNMIIDGCRITLSGGYGIDGTATAKNVFVLSTYIPAGGESLANTSGPTNGTIMTLADAAIDINDLAGTDSNGGYAPGTDVFNNATTATLFSTEQDLDGTNKVYATAGLKPNASGGSAGGGNLIGGSLIL